MGKAMSKEGKKKPKVTTTASNITNVSWASNRKQIREVKLAAKKAEKKKKE